MLVAFQFTDTVTLGSVILGIILSIIALGGIGYAIVRGGRIDELNKSIAICERTADGWHEERDLAVAKAERLTDELAAAKVEHAERWVTFEKEQQEVRHDLKNQLAACQLELSAEKKKTDLNVVLEGQQGILAALDRMDERSAKRDTGILATQREITELLKQLTERVTREVTEKVGEVVQEKVDQITTAEGGGTA